MAVFRAGLEAMLAMGPGHVVGGEECSVYVGAGRAQGRSQAGEGKQVVHRGKDAVAAISPIGADSGVILTGAAGAREWGLTAGLQIDAIQQDGRHGAEGQAHGRRIEFVVFGFFADVEPVVSTADLVDELRREAMADGGVQVLVKDVAIGAVAGVDLLVRQRRVMQLLQLLSDVADGPVGLVGLNDIVLKRKLWTSV